MATINWAAILCLVLCLGAICQKEQLHRKLKTARQENEELKKSWPRKSIKSEV